MPVLVVQSALLLGALAFLAGGFAFIVITARMRTRARWPETFRLALDHGGKLCAASMAFGAIALATGLLFLPPERVAEPAFAYTPALETGKEAGHDNTNFPFAATFVPAADAEPPQPNSPAPQVTLNPSMSTQTLQNALRQAPHGAHILFTAGTYNISQTLIIPCNDLHLSGPPAVPPKAILAASFTNSDILAYTTGCAALGSIEYLHLKNTGGVYFGGGDNSNFLFANNLVTHLPSGLSNLGSESGLFFDGSLDTTLSNILIRHNTFGDAQSCTAVYATVKDEGGNCAGILTSQGEVNHMRIEYNNFLHVEQGVHFNQLAQWAPGKPNSVCVSCAIEYNYIANYHRIGIEIQTSTPTDSILVEHNAIVDPINSSWGTFAVSMACCQWGHIMGDLGFSPGYIFNDNVLVATLPIGSECPPYGVEFWGHGSQGLNSLIQGTFCNGYTWGFGGGPWAVNHNYICGPDFVAKGGYITDQQHQGNPPQQSENQVAAKCSETPSIAPAIAPAGGSFSGSQLVTMTDQGLNTGIWYTTDGSNPVPGEGTAKYYTGPFRITTAATIKAVGMWGAPNQPLKYPSGYGYVPSRTVTATFTVASSV